jgi:hypothetical protein
MRRTILIVFCISLASSASFAQDDVMEKIRLLEQQIQELKLLKEQQSMSALKFAECMKAIEREKFCTCVSSNLPNEVGFEQYVHTVVTSREKLAYGAMTVEQQKVVDATIAVREKCIERGFFK